MRTPKIAQRKRKMEKPRKSSSVSKGGFQEVKIQIVDVSLRDGIQNETQEYSLERRLQMLNNLIRLGVKRLEIGAFVRYDRVPQMKPTAELIIKSRDVLPPGSRASVLVPNLKGMESAVAAGVSEVAVFTAASETFARKNINSSISESLENFRPVFKLAKEKGILVRAYVSTCFWCPFEKKIQPEQVYPVVKSLLDLGAYEVSIGDTLGWAVPNEVEKLLSYLSNKKIPLNKIAGHFHDTHHTALANVQKAIEMGVRTFDASFGGTGGCPFAPGAKGNLALEHLLFYLEKSGWQWN